jgi:hypothetical protein
MSQKSSAPAAKPPAPPVSKHSTTDGTKIIFALSKIYCNCL